MMLSFGPAVAVAVAAGRLVVAFEGVVVGVLFVESQYLSDAV